MNPNERVESADGVVDFSTAPFGFATVHRECVMLASGYFI
jgi:hypothetical protein